MVYIIHPLMSCIVRCESLRWKKAGVHTLTGKKLPIMKDPIQTHFHVLHVVAILFQYTLVGGQLIKGRVNNSLGHFICWCLLSLRCTWRDNHLLLGLHFLIFVLDGVIEKMYAQLIYMFLCVKVDRCEQSLEAC